MQRGDFGDYRRLRQFPPFGHVARLRNERVRAVVERLDILARIGRIIEGGIDCAAQFERGGGLYQRTSNAGLVSMFC